MTSIKANLSISRQTSREGRCIHIQIRDDGSGITFFDGLMSMESFAECITGLGHVEITQATVRNLHNVGKILVREPRTIKYTGPERDDRARTREKWLRQHGAEEGWSVDTYLNSQDSTFYKDGETYLRYAVFKYVEVVDEATSSTNTD